jgi:hypothetical protein
MTRQPFKAYLPELGKGKFGPGLYKTRHARKAEVFAARGSKLYGYLVDDRQPMVWQLDGRVGQFEGNDDLIAPWKEPVTVEGWVEVYSDHFGEITLGPPEYITVSVNQRNNSIDCRKLRYIEGKGIIDVTGEVL